MHLTFKTTCTDVLEENKRNLFNASGGGKDASERGSVYMYPNFLCTIYTSLLQGCMYGIFLLFRRVYSYVDRIPYTFVYDTLN